MDFMGIHGFTVGNWKHILLPTEDAYRFLQAGDVKIIANADGITRDPRIGKIIDISTILGKIKFVPFYPRLSPAYESARRFCNKFVRSIERFPQYYASKITLKDAFCNTNQSIAKFNEKYFPKPDYMKKDLAGCVASGALILGRDVFYGFIADSGFIVFDKKGNIGFKTPNEGPNSKGSIDEVVARRHKTSFKYPRGRAFIRSHYRNNPSEPLSYGALTGEATAMHYVKTGYYELREGEIPMVFTDGLEEALLSGKFADLIRRGKFFSIRNFCRKKVKTEGSLVYVLENENH